MKHALKNRLNNALIGAALFLTSCHNLHTQEQPFLTKNDTIVPTIDRIMNTDIQLIVVPDTFQAHQDPIMANYEIVNSSDAAINYASSITLAYYHHNTWIPEELPDDLGFDDMMHAVKAHQAKKQQLFINTLFKDKPIKPGSYRITKACWPTGQRNKTHYIHGFFTIKP